MNYAPPSLDRQLRNPLEDRTRVERLHSKIEAKMDKERPDPKDFEGKPPLTHPLYVYEDIQEVQRLEGIWAKEETLEGKHAKRLSDIAEFAIHNAIGNWTNAKINSLLTSKPDDYLRKVDMVLEIPNEDPEGESSFLPMAVDVVFVGAGESSQFKKKAEYLQDQLKKGKECEVRYVETENYKGSVKGPRAIIALSAEHLNDYISILESNNYDRLHTHITREIILYQLQLQYQAYFQVSNNRGNTVLAEEYAIANNQAIEIFGPIYEKIQADPELNKRIEQDPGFKAIQQLCSDCLKM